MCCNLWCVIHENELPLLASTLNLRPIEAALIPKTSFKAQKYLLFEALILTLESSSSVNAGAPPENEKSMYAGLSRVAMPFVGALGDETKDTNREGMSVVDVDMEMVEEAEKSYKVRADIEGEGWHYTYRHQGGGKVE